MQQEGDKATLTMLLQKIKKLRTRLLSYGWNKHEAFCFIMYEFLKLPRVTWEEADSTESFYRIKEKFRVEAGTAELMMMLQQAVPNLQTQEVLEYLHSVCHFSTMQYGFEFDSSSDSDSPNIHRKPKDSSKRPVRAKTFCPDPDFKLSKRIHREEEIPQGNKFQTGKCLKKEVKLVKKRVFPQFSEFDDEIDKEVKKI